MAVWVILRAADALAALPEQIRVELTASLRLTDSETARWEDVTRRMFVPFHDGVLSQFEGYAALAELDWDGYRRRYGDIQRLDRILEAEGDDVNRYRASKQADVLMLFYLLSADELGGELLGHLGHRLDGDTIPRTIDYYLSRTSHGSTLSAVVHAWVLTRRNRHEAMKFFTTVLASDVTDIQGGTTSEVFTSQPCRAASTCCSDASPVSKPAVTGWCSPGVARAARRARVPPSSIAGIGCRSVSPAGRWR